SNKVSINYSKKDTDGNPINGTRFTVYELDSQNNDFDLYFIHQNKSIDLLNVLEDKISSYDRNNLSISLSERFNRYLDETVINAKEKGYFPFKLYNGNDLIDEGIMYVSDGIDDTNGSYCLRKVRKIGDYYSSNSQVNTISNLESAKNYYLCESEPQKGYVYTDNPCKLINTSDENKVYDFVNEKRDYNLRLIKENPDHTIVLNGAKFRLTYSDDGNEKEMIFVTGALNLRNKHNRKYVLYRHENNENINVEETNGEYFIKKNMIPGKYYYCFSDDTEIDKSLLNKTVNVIDGGYEIEDLPYSSTLTIEELEAPKGYYIEEPTYELDPDISYSEIVFKNYRVNSFEIVPNNKRKIPKTCIGE
ncbi:MAG: hypothetical protein IK151_07905, partial [Erysipelotrichaceae bacterium]|nr:hypothetical protein [Erysipelotrichaceae bacterium]